MTRSLMDIQAEQEQERERQNNAPSPSRRSSSGKNSSSNRNDKNDTNPRGSLTAGAGSYHRTNSQSNYRNQGNRGGRGGGRGGKPDRSQLPLEFGRICSMKDKFGFIHCADRPTEMFFHYSEVTNVQPDDLQLDDEVEFRVGKSRDDPDKLSALEVYRLPTGTVEWEYEEKPGERFQGLVDRPVLRSTNNTRRGSNADASSEEGLIRLLVPAEENAESKEDLPADNDDVEKLTTTDGPKIRFTGSDYNPESNISPNEDGGIILKRKDSTSSTASQANRLYRGDLVEFSLVIEKRTRQKFARNITLLQSERERAHIAKEAELLANATQEQGVVVGLKQDFGFLRSNSRRDEVYFHYSNVCLPEEGDDDEHELQVGQDMEFLVVTEEVEDHNKGTTKNKISAREIKFLPKGTVEFEKVVAEGVTGLVSIVPRADSDGRKSQSGSDPQGLGTIRLKNPITIISPRDKKSEMNVDTVKMHVSDSPGGLFTSKHGISQGLWIREGDTLLFDVLYDYVDSTCYARPTKHLVPFGSPLSSSSSSTEVENKNNDKEEEVDGKEKGKGKGKNQKSSPPGSAIRLISLALAGRAEGTIHSIKEAYGFIHFAERAVDVHFKNFELIPDEIQEDLRRNMGLTLTSSTKAEMMGFHMLKVGTEVQFDLSVQGTVMTQDKHPHRGANKRWGNKDEPHMHERENLKAQRVLILPNNTILQTKTIGLGLEAVVTKEDPNQPYAGTLNLEQEMPQMALEERHPLVVKMVEEFMNDTGTQSLVFHDIQSPKEEDVIADILDIKVRGKVSTTHIPQAGASNYPGRLCIRKIPEGEQHEAGAAKSEETKFEAGGTSVEAEETTPGEAEETSAGEKSDMARSLSSNHGSSRSPEGRSKSPKGRDRKKKAQQSKTQPIQTVRFDKSSLINEAKSEIPPGMGDVVTCDIYQIRRTGKVHLENLQVKERKKFDPEEATSADEVEGVGVVKEVVLASKFGFISVSDENASKRELLFFHFDSVANPHHINNQHHLHKNKRGGIHAADAVIHKGDEVKFKIGRSDNGKRVAVDIRITNAGYVPNAVDKDACRGYILVEPTDTKVGAPLKRSRSFTRSKEPTAPQHHNSGGRWDHVKEKDDNTKDSLASKGEGVILLLEDPTNMFSAPAEESQNMEDHERGNSQAKHSNNGDIVKCQLLYKNGGIAIQGAGAPATLDNSQNPHRGDLVTFVKSKGKNVKDIRVVSRASATLVRGHLENIDRQSNRARFVATMESETKNYTVDLKEVVSCDIGQLKEKVSVEGILHNDAIYGVCRTMDLRLESKLGTGKKERPKLNLTVKKNRAGTIMAQSMMAKGPDGTTGFTPGWTKRVSRYSGTSGGAPQNASDEGNGDTTDVLES